MYHVMEVMVYGCNVIHYSIVKELITLLSVSVTPSASQSYIDSGRNCKRRKFQLRHLQCYAALSAVVFLAAAQAFGTMSLI